MRFENGVSISGGTTTLSNCTVSATNSSSVPPLTVSNAQSFTMINSFINCTRDANSDPAIHFTSSSTGTVTVAYTQVSYITPSLLNLIRVDGNPNVTIDSSTFKITTSPTSQQNMINIFNASGNEVTITSNEFNMNLGNSGLTMIMVVDAFATDNTHLITLKDNTFVGLSPIAGVIYYEPLVSVPHAEFVHNMFHLQPTQTYLTDDTSASGTGTILFSQNTHASTVIANRNASPHAGTLLYYGDRDLTASLVANAGDSTRFALVPTGTSSYTVQPDDASIYFIGSTGTTPAVSLLNTPAVGPPFQYEYRKLTFRRDTTGTFTFPSASVVGTPTGAYNGLTLQFYQGSWYCTDFC